jgi:hypothetical protein
MARLNIMGKGEYQRCLESKVSIMVKNNKTLTTKIYSKYNMNEFLSLSKLFFKKTI